MCDLTSFLNNLNWLNSSSFLLMFLFFGFMLPLASHYSVPTVPPFLPLSCSTFILLFPVFSQCLPGDSGVYACTLRGFWILRKFGFNSLLPTAFFGHQYFIMLLIACGTHGCNELLWVFVHECVSCGFFRF